MLRESLAACGNINETEEITKYKQVLKVHYFDELDDVDPNLKELLNNRIHLTEQECLVQLANRQAEFDYLT